MEKEILKNIISDFTLRIDSQGNSTDLENRYNYKFINCFFVTYKLEEL